MDPSALQVKEVGVQGDAASLTQGLVLKSLLNTYF